MPGLLDRLVPPGVRNHVWRALDWPARMRFRRALAGTALAPQFGAPALNYGDALTPDSAGLVHGGRVKLTHLAAEFPPATDFNLLYLVSSAPPKFATDLVRWAQSKGAKLAWNQNGVAYPAWFGDRVEEINGPMRALRARADYIFYQSEFCRACADRFLGEVPASFEIAYNAVDTARFVPGIPPSEETCELLVAGSHHDDYRVLSVLDTVGELKRRNVPVRLHLAGRLLWKDAEAEVAARIREFNLAEQVRRIPPYRQEDAPAIYQAAHILIHPKYKDPCPTVPIEAMACGVPVIGSASGGMPELVAADSGVLLEVADSWEQNHWPAPTAMADAVQQIMRDWTRYSAITRTNAAARFSTEKWLAQHRRVFHTLVSAK
jgi:glycosyltransferase involved in cell wall biosynthesis